MKYASAARVIRACRKSSTASAGEPVTPDVRVLTSTNTTVRPSTAFFVHGNYVELTDAEVDRASEDVVAEPGVARGDLVDNKLRGTSNAIQLDCPHCVLRAIITQVMRNVLMANAALVFSVPGFRVWMLVSLMGMGLISVEAEPIRDSVMRLDGERLSPDQVEETVARLMEGGHVTGLGLAVLNNGRVKYLRGFGYRDVEKKLPFTEETATMAASFTKSVFAYLVMQLVDEGVIDLNTPIQEWVDKPLSEFLPLVDLAGDERLGAITPAMCLSHTSGLPNWRWIGRDGRVDGKGRLAIWFDPGTQYSYSGEGIQLLQLGIQEGKGLKVGELMQRRVFDRFGMSRTSMVWRDDFAADCAFGYDEQGNPRDFRRFQHASAAGSATTTIADMGRFLVGVLQCNGLSQAAREKMLSPQVRIRSRHQFPVGSTEAVTDNDGVKLSYGLGWGLLETPHGRAFFKEGHDEGWENYMIAFDDPKTAIILMTNSANGESIFKSLLAELIGDVYTPWRWEGYIPYDAKLEE